MKAKSQKAAICIGNISVKIQDLLQNYPPHYYNQRKNNYYKKAYYFHRKQNGIIKISRWTFNYKRKSPLDLTKHPLVFRNQNGFYTYEESTDTNKVWWVNFADENLFGYYGSDLFAQDEIQTLEHPLLGSVVEYLDINEIPNLISKTEEKNRVTPFFVENVPYWISVNVNPILSSGETANIYGRNFSQEQEDIVNLGIKIIQKDIKNNIIAMAAPSCGKGEYTEDQLQKLMETVLVAFGGAVKITSKERFEKCIIHTGNWGCGAFGNNIELMYLSQLLAASFVGVDELVFHNANENILMDAEKKYLNLQTENLILFLKGQHYLWNQSDGN